MSLTCHTVCHLSIVPHLQSTLRSGDTFILVFGFFFTSCQAAVGLSTHCLWCSSSLFPRRGTPSLFLVYRILMTLNIALIINIIMVAIVTVNVVIAGIMMMICFVLFFFFYSWF